jgi:hypothetical protein
MTGGRGGPPAPAAEEAAERWLAEHVEGAAASQALTFFDELPPVEVADLLGRWRGSELATGSPLDGLLELYGWYGKHFIDPETVHPLLFRDRAGVPRPVNPALVPLTLVRRRPHLVRNRIGAAAFAGLRPLLSTRRPAARLRMVEHRGVLTAAMIYDTLPITDVFRRVGRDSLLGLTDMRGLDQPCFFVLRRDAPRAA